MDDKRERELLWMTKVTVGDKRERELLWMTKERESYCG